MVAPAASAAVDGYSRQHESRSRPATVAGLAPRHLRNRPGRRPPRRRERQVQGPAFPRTRARGVCRMTPLQLAVAPPPTERALFTNAVARCRPTRTSATATRRASGRRAPDDRYRLKPSRLNFLAPQGRWPDFAPVRLLISDEVVSRVRGPGYWSPVLGSLPKPGWVVGPRARSVGDPPCGPV